MSRPSARWGAIIALLGWLGPVVSALANPEVVWGLDREAVVAGNRAVLQFTVIGHANPPPPDIPAVPGLSIQFAGRMAQISQVDGRATQATMFRYAVSSDQPGRYIIGPIRYMLDGREFRPGPLGLTIEPKPDAASARDVREVLADRLFATLEIGRSPVYQQEFTTLDLKIFYANLNLGSEVTLMDLNSQSLELGRFEEIRAAPERVNNRIFYVRQFRAWVRPVAAGRFELAPTLRVQLLVREENRRDPLFDNPLFRGMVPDGIFGSVRQHPVNLLTRPLVFEVKPLPVVGQPEGFTGAVGQFAFEAALDRDSVGVGEPVTLSMTLRGQGNIAEVSPPSYQETEDLRVYSPRLARSELSDARVSGTRVFEQVVIPRSTQARLPEVRFSWFDPAQESYITATRGPFPLTIQAPAGGAAQVVSAPGAPNGASARGVRRIGEDILYLKPAPAGWVTGAATATTLPLAPWMLHGLPLLVVAGAWIYDRRRRWRSAHPDAVRKSRAPRAARDGLLAARAAVDTEPGTAGLAMGRTVRDYFGHRFNLGPGDGTPDRLDQELRSAGAAESVQKKLRAVMEFADACSYGSAVAPSAEDARARLLDLEEVIRACERIRR